MNSIDKTIADCYSSGDRHMMVWWAGIRRMLLLPLLRFLNRLSITANGITYLGLLLGISFLPLLFVSPLCALGALALHVLLDGLDGPLARFRGTDSRAGSFTDTVCDQVVVTTTTIGLIYYDVLSAPAGVLYVFVYTAVIVFSMIRNAMGAPYRFVIRPRFFIYACIPVELYLFPGSITLLTVAMIVPLSVSAFLGYRKIRALL